MGDHKGESPKNNEEEAFYMLAHCFKCAVCKKFINRNKKKQVMGMFTWKLIPVCPDCFAVLGLEVTHRVGA